MPIYDVHDLAVESSLDLGFDLTSRAADLHIDEVAGPFVDPSTGRVLARVEYDDGFVSSHVVLPEGDILSTYSDLAQFRWRGTRVTANAGTAADSWLPTFLSANYPALLLFARGRVPLHGSAVWMPALGRAVVVMGPPGAGKTTVAAGLVKAGGQLLSDDVVSIQWDGGRPFVDKGCRALRLRQGAEEFLDPWVTHESPDGRVVVDCRSALPGPFPLGWVVRPLLDRGGAPFTVARMGPIDAFRLLSGDPRVKGLEEAGWLKAAVDLAAALSRAVPCLEMTIPFRDKSLAPIGEGVSRLCEGIG